MQRDYIQYITNLGILISLLLVGYQIYLDRRIAEANIYIDSYTLEADRWIASLGEDPADVVARAATESQTLTPRDAVVLEAYVGWFISMMQRDAIREEYGLRDASWKEEHLPTIGRLLGATTITKEILLNIQIDEEWFVELQRIAKDSELKYGRHLNELLESARTSTGA